MRRTAVPIRNRCLLVAGLTAAAGAAVAVPAAQAAWPGVNGRIALTQRVPAGPGIARANRDIFAYALDGDVATRARLTTTLDNEEQGSWSPDGRWLAFKRRDAVWIVAADGTGLRALTETVTTDGHNSTQPAWSPDGTQILFRDNTRRAPANVADIWVMDAPSGANKRAIIELTGDARYPTFSPDGTKILFRGDTDGLEASGDEEIFVADADGSNVVRLTDDDAVDSAPAWWPDGSKIAFESERDGADLEIYVMDADGSNIVRLTDNDVHDEGPAISPDGRRIAFTRADTPLTAGDIWTMSADGSAQAPLSATDIIEESPDWQPLPLAVGAAGIPRDACGDVSLLPGGLASIVSVKSPCQTATVVAQRWHAAALGGAEPGGVEGFDCASAPHSFDQVVVQCDHSGVKKGIGFVIRQLPAG